MGLIDKLSLGWRTDLIFPRFDAEVIERDDYVVVRTPQNPTFYWGNFVLFDRAPREGDFARWHAIFARELASVRPAHLAFGVDVAEAFACPPDFERARLSLSPSTVLTMTKPQLQAAPELPVGITIRRLALPDEAAALLELDVARNAGEHEEAGFRVYRARQLARYAAMSAAGLGSWYGVFADSTLVAGCGLFRDQRLGRFQHVETHPAWRRRGLCRALMHAVCRDGFDAMSLDTLVIVADPRDVAIGLYESIGFARGTDTWQFERRPVG